MAPKIIREGKQLTKKQTIGAVWSSNEICLKNGRWGLNSIYYEHAQKRVGAYFVIKIVIYVFKIISSFLIVFFFQIVILKIWLTIIIHITKWRYCPLQMIRSFQSAASVNFRTCVIQWVCGCPCGRGGGVHIIIQWSLAVFFQKSPVSLRSCVCLQAGRA